jgi:predicted DNA-binding protein (MmcQ/YjbR family)
MKKAYTKDGRLARVMQICLALPEAIQEPAGSHATFLVRKATFAYYLNNHHGDGIISVCCKVLPGDNEALIAAHPEKFYMPAYIGPRGWVALRLDVSGLDWNEVAELVVGSYQLIAPKRLALLTNAERAREAAARSGGRPLTGPRPRTGPPARKNEPRRMRSGPAKK